MRQTKVVDRVPNLLRDERLPFFSRSYRTQLPNQNNDGSARTLTRLAGHCTLVVNSMPLKPVQVYAGGLISWIWMRERSLLIFQTFLCFKMSYQYTLRPQVTIIF